MKIPVYICDGCGALMIPHSQHKRRAHLRRRYRAHRARGLCATCYQRHRYTERLIDFERWSRSADDMLDDWAMLRDDGYGVRQAAERMGVEYDALDNALCRAKRRGDPRGSRVPFARDMQQEAM